MPHLPPLKSVGRIDSSTSSWPRHNSARGFSFSCWLLTCFWSFRIFWVLSQYNSQLTSATFNLSGGCLNYVRSRSTCWWDNFLIQAHCGDPHFCIIWYRCQVLCMMSQIKVLFLFLFLLPVQLSKAFQIRPWWYEHLVGLRDWCSKPSPHVHFCWT